MKKHSTIVGIFDKHTEAVDAIKELRQSGFSDDQIGFVVRHTTDDPAMQSPNNALARGVVGGLLGAADVLLLPVTGPGDASTIGTSIITGSVIGGTLGAVAALLIPGIGPVVAGGILAATFGGAAIGGIAGGFLGMGIPEHKAQYYEQQFQAGRIILTIKTDGQAHQTLDILRQYGAHEVEVH